MDLSDPDLEAPLAQSGAAQLPSQTRMLQLQLKHKIADQPSCSNKWTRSLFFTYHALKLMSGIEIILMNQHELPWAFTISVYSVLVLFYIITQYYVEKIVRGYLRRNAFTESEMGAVKRLLRIQTCLNCLTVALAISCLVQYWWALAIIAINHAWGSGDGTFGFIFSNLIFESFFLLPVQLLLMIISLHGCIQRIRGDTNYAAVRPEPVQAPVARQTEAQQANRNNRQVLKYSKMLPGDDVCAICQINYEDGDNVIQLPCNAKHYYHEGCTQSWFRIRRICPLCRARVGSSFVV